MSEEIEELRREVAYLRGRIDALERAAFPAQWPGEWKSPTTANPPRLPDWPYNQAR